MNELARELNRALAGTVAEALLSEFGRRLYFPRGVVTQSAEAKKRAYRLNATAGIATLGSEPLALPCLLAQIPSLGAEEICNYAPTAGREELRELWLAEMLDKNPALAGLPTSRPVVVSGLTQGISLLGDLFVDPGDTVVLADPFWGNYGLIFAERHRARLSTFPFFDSGGGFNSAGLGRSLASLARGKAVLLLNFPNNPTGYSPARQEVEQILRVLVEAAEAGTRLLLILDDAYFGLFYEEHTYRQSLFADTACLHENILAVKVDGATKEDLVWGLRLGFLTFASRGLTAAQHEALTQKLLGALRSSVSSSSQLSQSLLLRVMKAPAYQDEKRRVFDLLEQRYRRSREVLRAGALPLSVLPFNSGYFLCFATGGLSAERLRTTLLAEQGIGAISIQDRYLRVAYSSVDLERLEELYGRIIETAARLSR